MIDSDFTVVLLSTSRVIAPFPSKYTFSWGLSGSPSHSSALIAPPPAFPGAIVQTVAPLIAFFYIAAISERAWLFYRSR